jgi:thiamine transporter
MRSQRIRLIVEIALTVALSVALKVFAVRLPWNLMGGEISLQMLPLLVLALRRGFWPALAAGSLFGVIAVIGEAQYVVAPIQFLLDYPVAFAAIAITGLGSSAWHRAVSDGHPIRAEFIAAGWILTGSAARFAMHFVSGMIFFASLTPHAGQSDAVYSLVYNISYMGPSTVICAAAALVLLPVLEFAVPTQGRTTAAVAT